MPFYNRRRSAVGDDSPIAAARPKPPMKSFVLVSILLVPALAGCSRWGGRAGDPANLSLACEVSRCECRSPQSGWSFRDTPGQPVAWRADGSAYCPAGLSLSRIAQ
jgi:hypothetical protein